MHATPVRDEPPFAIDRIARDTVVVDLAYGQEETRLAAAVRARGRVVVDGWRVLEVEVDRQFRLLTGRSGARTARCAPGSRQYHRKGSSSHDHSR